MAEPTDREALARRYLGFARDEARGNSPLYEALSNHVAATPALLDFIAGFPAELQQPNLFLAALRLVAGTPAGPEALVALVAAHGADIARVMHVRRTQTNEAGRCAALLPVLAGLAGPLALIEVGAAAGLCLLPDKYGYDYGTRRLDAPADTHDIAPVLRCDASANTPLPDRLPEVVWRAGLDLNPLSPTDPGDMAWLETLVWPEQADRLARLRAAAAVARRVDPGVVRGDLRHDLAALAARAPRTARLVIFHTAVLTYVPAQADRDGFAAACADLGATWISNESPWAYPRIAARAGAGPPGMFLISVNGAPIAWTRPHGQSLDWL